MQPAMQGLRHYTLVLAIMDSDEEAYNIFNARSSDESEPEPQESSSSEEYGEEEPDVNTSSASDEPDIDERAPRASNISSLRISLPKSNRRHKRLRPSTRHHPLPLSDDGF